MKHRRVIIWLFRENEIIGCHEPKGYDFLNLTPFDLKKNLAGRKSLHLNVSYHDCLNLDATCTQFFMLEIYILFHLHFFCFLQNEKGMKLASIQILRIIKIWKDGFIFPEHFWLKCRNHWKYRGRKNGPPTKKSPNQHNEPKLTKPTNQNQQKPTTKQTKL